MKSKKGFTLMELLVAVFIASMVTIALVTIWKAASLQTSQGQRQTMIRNNLSILMRALHRDITEADLVLAPYKGSTGADNGQSGGALVLVRNGHLKPSGNSKQVAGPEVSSFTEGGPKYESEPQVIAYCIQGADANNKKIRRVVAYIEGTNNEVEELVSDMVGTGGLCETGRIYMDYVADFTVSTDDNINYKVKVAIHKDFTDSETPPIHIEMEKTFIKAGGI